MCLGYVLVPVNNFGCFPFVTSYVQPKCERYWCDEMNKPFELPDRGFTVTMTGKKVYADYEIRDMTIRCVSLHASSCMSYNKFDSHYFFIINPFRLLTHLPSPSNWSTFSSLLGLTMVCPSTPTPWSSSSSMSGRCFWTAQHHWWSIAGQWLWESLGMGMSGNLRLGKE